MIKRDIQPQWRNFVTWFWENYDGSKSNYLTIWNILEQDYGAKRIRPMGSPGWSVMQFPNEQSYTMFLLRWS